jgi:hypothetical protein
MQQTMCLLCVTCVCELKDRISGSFFYLVNESLILIVIHRIKMHKSEYYAAHHHVKWSECVKSGCDLPDKIKSVYIAIL